MHKVQYMQNKNIVYLPLLFYELYIVSMYNVYILTCGGNWYICKISITAVGGNW